MKYFFNMIQSIFLASISIFSCSSVTTPNNSTAIIPYQDQRAVIEESIFRNRLEDAKALINPDLFETIAQARINQINLSRGNNNLTADCDSCAREIKTFGEINPSSYQTWLKHISSSNILTNEEHTDEEKIMFFILNKELTSLTTALAWALKNNSRQVAAILIPLLEKKCTVEESKHPALRRFTLKNLTKNINENLLKITLVIARAFVHDMDHLHEMLTVNFEEEFSNALEKQHLPTVTLLLAALQRVFAPQEQELITLFTKVLSRCINFDKDLAIPLLISGIQQTFSHNLKAQHTIFSNNETFSYLCLQSKHTLIALFIQALNHACAHDKEELRNILTCSNGKDLFLAAAGGDVQTVILLIEALQNAYVENPEELRRYLETKLQQLEGRIHSEEIQNLFSQAIEGIPVTAAPLEQTLPATMT